MRSTETVAQRLQNSGRLIAFQNRFRRRDGGYRTISWRATVSPTKERYYAVALDVTDKIAAAEGASLLAAVLERSGEAIKLFVVVKPGDTLSKEQVMAHMRANVTGYKVPRAIEFRDSLPTTNVGKILRRELRDEELKKVAGK